jgi:tetratricopeptide (TPR) repeat protein
MASDGRHRLLAFALGRGMLLASFWLGGPGAMALDVAPLWNFSDPAGSEQRFRQALAGASGDDALELQTQIARTWGLRGDFATARRILDDIQARIPGAGAQAQVRWHLELGRTHASPAHRPEQITPEAREKARAAYLQAFEKAKAARLDYLAVDALHMMVVVDDEPSAQLAWNEKALAHMEGSSQEEARKWEGPLRNNLGYAYHLAGRYDEAIAQFRLSLAAYERAGRAGNARIAHWMIARTLRHQGKVPEAIAIQLRLEREYAAAGETDPYVFEELEKLHRESGDAARADAYAARLKESRRAP